MKAFERWTSKIWVPIFPSCFLKSDFPRIAQHLPDIKGQGVDGDLKCKKSVVMSMVPKGPIGLTYRLSLLFGGYDGGLGMVVCTSTRVMVMVMYLGSGHEHVGEWELRLMRFQLRNCVYKCRKYLDTFVYTHMYVGACLNPLIVAT